MIAMFRAKCNIKDSDFIQLLNVSNLDIIWSSLKSLKREFLLFTLNNFIMK